MTVITTFLLLSLSLNKKTDWIDDATIYEVNLRQYTEKGTFEAFREHLPRLKELGVEVLWFMPIHPISEVEKKGELGSYYAVADYKEVNPEFGTMEEFKALVEECHDMGFKVILDWVANHTGWDNQWITDHPEWYTQVNGEITIPAGTNWTDVADLNYDNEEMRQEMIDALVFWVEEADIDGYRCDVAGSVPVDFWEDARVALDKVKPVFMLAEDGSNYSLLDNAFDANYNWYLLDSINTVANGGRASAIRSDIRRAAAVYPDGTFPMNFVTNHDENSWNGTTEERLGTSRNLMDALVFTAPGIPLIYSGQEANLNKRLLFFDKDEINWSDLSKQDYYERLIDLKKENEALWNGSVGGDLTFIDTTEKSILAYVRTKDNNNVVFIGNFIDQVTEFTLKSFDESGQYRNYFTSEEVTLEEGINLELGPWAYYILVRD
ncbi:alpha-amylase family glycosyl hydrolase [Vallitalea okinawensis]|uniref:alpha-amylase family glycosyl hydrolase n=1 Tax=Vallitalea okinawensis TaxID=2078660 RepID=UPI001478FC24|nr:alpha-amylase family glycosyl hydrolase [Vallitalea okinawensis]